MSHNPYWNAKNGAKPWTRKDDERLLELAGKGIVYRDIGTALKRTVAAIRLRIRIIDPDRKVRPAKDFWTNEQIERARQLIADKADRSVFPGLTGHTFEQARMKMMRVRVQQRAAAMEPPPSLVVVPDEVIEERARRQIAPRDLTGVLMGDPPKGFSALEGRR